MHIIIPIIALAIYSLVFIIILITIWSYLVSKPLGMETLMDEVNKLVFACYFALYVTACTLLLLTEAGIRCAYPLALCLILAKQVSLRMLTLTMISHSACQFSHVKYPGMIENLNQTDQVLVKWLASIQLLFVTLELVVTWVLSGHNPTNKLGLLLFGHSQGQTFSVQTQLDSYVSLAYIAAALITTALLRDKCKALMTFESFESNNLLRTAVFVKATSVLFIAAVPKIISNYYFKIEHFSDHHFCFIFIGPPVFIVPFLIIIFNHNDCQLHVKRKFNQYYYQCMTMRNFLAPNRISVNETVTRERQTGQTDLEAIT